jgi:hypothetical protein
VGVRTDSKKATLHPQDPLQQCPLPRAQSAAGVARGLIVLFFGLWHKEWRQSIRTGIPASDAGCSTTDPAAFWEH